MHSGLTAILISHNSNDYLPVSLTSIEESAKGFPFQIIVVDNASEQSPKEVFEDQFPNVVWIESKENLGFGKACNLGVEQAKYDNLFFINPDTLLAENTFEGILNFIRDKNDLGIVGCKILNGDGSLQAACRRNFPSPSGAIYHTFGLDLLFPESKTFGQYNLTYLDEDEIHELDAVSGSFFWIHKKIYQEVQGFDEDFFLYGEDLDLCYRVKQLGLKNVYFPEVKVMHFKGHSSNQKPWRTSFHFYNAMRIFARKHSMDTKVPIPIIELGIILSALVGFLARFVSSFKRVFFESALIVFPWVLGLFLSQWEPVGSAKWLLPVMFIQLLGSLFGGRMRKSHRWNIDPVFTLSESLSLVGCVPLLFFSGLDFKVGIPLAIYLVLKVLFYSNQKILNFFVERSWRVVTLGRLSESEEKRLKEKSFIDWCGWLMIGPKKEENDAFCLGNLEELHTFTHNLGITHLVMQPRTFKPAQKVLFCGEFETKASISRILFPSLKGKTFVEINLKNLQ